MSDHFSIAEALTETDRRARIEAAQQERAAIVAWLRAMADGYPADIRKSCLLTKADMIERLDHLPNPTDGG